MFIVVVTPEDKGLIQPIKPVTPKHDIGGGGMINVTPEPNAAPKQCKCAYYESEFPCKLYILKGIYLFKFYACQILS